MVIDGPGSDPLVLAVGILVACAFFVGLVVGAMCATAAIVWGAP